MEGFSHNQIGPKCRRFQAIFAVILTESIISDNINLAAYFSAVFLIDGYL